MTTSAPTTGTAMLDGVDIAYEAHGLPSGDPVILVSGFASSMAWWDQELVARLVERACYVVKIDNRDTGFSSRLPAPYTLHEMAADIVGVLDHLDVAAAHLVGVSMGGMIVQTVALDHPDRTASLCSVMSSPRWSGNGHVPRDILDSLAEMGVPTTREEFIETTARGVELCGSRGLPIDWDGVRRRAGDEWDRGRPTHGLVNQIAALDGQDDRTDMLRQLSVPTLVIHGTIDPLVPPALGRAVADAVPGSRLLLIEGMGHDLPPCTYPEVVDAIADNMARHTES